MEPHTMAMEAWNAVPAYRKALIGQRRYLRQIDTSRSCNFLRPVMIEGRDLAPDRVEMNYMLGIAYVFNGDRLVRTMRNCKMGHALAAASALTGVTSIQGTPNNY